MKQAMYSTAVGSHHGKQVAITTAHFSVRTKDPMGISKPNVLLYHLLLLLIKQTCNMYQHYFNIEFQCCSTKAG